MTERDLSYDTAIAIIGMSGRFPGAADVGTFWQNIAAGTKSIRFFSEDELRAAGVEASVLSQPGYIPAGAVLENVDQFDAAFFGYAARDAQITDPQQRFFLECAWEALENAGYDPERYRGLVGVFGGSGFSTYMLNNLYNNPALAGLIDPLQVSIGNDRDALASTVSYKMNLKGPSLSVQTFCSTSLVAVHLACQSLLNYECDMALAGGVAIQVPHVSGYTYKEGGIVSPDGACRTFDARAQGSVMGNGAGVVTLKRLADALEDGDSITAVIRGSAINNDGSVRVSYTAPGLDGQSEVIAEALGHADVPADSISYIEAHGTATMLGDSVELAAMKKAFALSTDKKQFCAIGSVKPNIGHLDRASGVTGLIKAALALQQKVLPPSLNFEHAHPDIDLENSPFYVNTQARPWPASSVPRRAGVSSFGLGGTNAHVILEEAAVPEPSGPSRPWQLFTFSTRTESALSAATIRLSTYLGEHPQINLADAAYTLNVGRSAFNHRRFVVGRNRNEAIKALKETPFSMHQTFRDRGVALLLPGVGEQYVGMAQDLYQQEAVFRRGVDRCCAFLQEYLELDLKSILFPVVNSVVPVGNNGATAQKGLDLRSMLGRGGARSQAQNPASEQLKQTAIAQPATFVIEYALAQLLMTWGIKPRALLGYSLGEYVAACLAGVFSLEDALLLVAKRAQLIQKAQHGAMVAVALSEEAVGWLLDEQISLAAVNSPQTCVLSGSLEAIELLEERLADQGIANQRIETTHAFHSSMLSPLREAVTALVRGITLHAPQIPYISNVTGTWITAEQATAPTYWAEHMCRTVLFAEGVRHLLEETEYAVLEVGIGQALGSFVRQHPACTGSRATLVVATLPSMHERQAEQAALLTALGKLWLAGVKIDWQGFYAHEHRRRVPLPTYPFERQRYWIDAPRLRMIEIEETVLPARPEPVEQGKKASLADWFYQPVWEERALDSTAAPVPEVARPWLVFLDESGPGERLVKRLREAGRTVTCVRIGEGFARVSEDSFCIRPGKRTDYLELCQSLANQHLLPGTIVHAWSLLPVPEQSLSHSERFDLGQEHGLYSLIYLTQALDAQVYSEPLQIIVLSSQLHAVTGQEALEPLYSTILGACKVIPQEHLNMICRNLDLDDPSDEYFPDQLIAECNVSGGELVVAYRNRKRFVQTYQPLQLTRDAIVPAFRQQGVYLLTGGLGGIGLTVAEYLAREVQARLVLLGRSSLPGKDEWAGWLATHPAEERISTQIRRIQAIEALGSEVIVLSVDVADAGQLQQALSEARAHFGVLHGVFHGAGTSETAAFKAVQEIGPAECAMHFRPKVHGLYALAEAVADIPLDFCLLYSSLASILGGLGFVGYTAANIFMDACADQHNQHLSSSTPWISINWDTWQVKASDHGLLGATIEQYAMLPAEATEALARVVSSGKKHLINSTGDLQTRMDQWLRREIVRDLAVTSRHSGAASPRPELSTAYEPAGEDYEQNIVQVWQQVLGVEPIGIHDNFFELGGHSLMGTQLIGRLRQAFQVDLPLAILFEAPTVAELVLAIKLKMLEEIDQLDDREVQSLV